MGDESKWDLLMRAAKEFHSWLLETIETECSWAPEKVQILTEVLDYLYAGFNLTVLDPDVRDSKPGNTSKKTEDAQARFIGAFETIAPLVKPQLNISTLMLICGKGGVATFLSKLTGITKKMFTQQLTECLTAQGLDGLVRRLENYL